MKQTEAINVFYSIANILEDDVEAVAYILQLVRGRPKQVFNDLENLNLLRYENELEALLDLHTETLKDLRKMYLNYKEKHGQLDTKTGKVLPRMPKHKQNGSVPSLL